MLVIDKVERDKCRQVRKRLKELYEKCKTNPEYAISSSSESAVLPRGPSSGLSGAQGETLDERNDMSAGEQNRESIMARAKHKLRSWCF